MKRFIAWCKRESDNGEMFVWVTLAIMVTVTIGMLIYGIISGSTAL